jgi:hypothetical protein
MQWPLTCSYSGDLLHGELKKYVSAIKTKKPKKKSRGDERLRTLETTGWPMVLAVTRSAVAVMAVVSPLLLSVAAQRSVAWSVACACRTAAGPFWRLM